MKMLVIFMPLTLIGCVSPKASMTTAMSKSNADAPTHTLLWKPSPDSGVFYEVQHSPQLDRFSLFAYTEATNLSTDPNLDTDFFRVRAVRNNGFHSSEASDWASQ